MQANQLYRQTKQQLAEGGIEDAAAEGGLLLHAATGFERFDREEVPPEAEAALTEMVRRRLTREPLQYILGSWPFMGMELLVGPGVLAPRPETEEVCLAAIDTIKNVKTPRVLDLCAGTGALALGIQKMRPNADITAVEYYPEAYDWLADNLNAFTPGTAGGKKPRSVLADALKYYEETPENHFDLIVSNPPYVTADEYEGLAAELYHEPRTALVAEGEGLAFFDAFARHYRTRIAPGGHMVWEIGAAQGEATAALLTQNGFTGVHVIRDINGLDRIAVGRRE